MKQISAVVDIDTCLDSENPPKRDKKIFRANVLK